MKILFVLEYFYPYLGWAETLFFSIVEWLVSQWHKVIVVTSRFDNDLPAKEKIGEVTIYRVWKSRYDFLYKATSLCTELSKDVDLIHTSTYTACIPAKIAGMRSKKKVVITIHEIFWNIWYDFKWWKWFIYKLYEGLLFKLNFHKYICVSNYVKNMARVNFGLDDGKAITIHNGIDYTKFQEENVDLEKTEELKDKYNLHGKFIGTFLWRPGRTKGLEYYIQSIPTILKNIPDFRAFLILLESENEGKIRFIQDLIRENEIEDKVNILYDIPYANIAHYMNIGDFIIVPSISEWFGYVAVESCALGKPVIVSDTASLPEVASGFVNYARPADPESIANSIINLYNGYYENIPSKKFRFTETLGKHIQLYTTI